MINISKIYGITIEKNTKRWEKLEKDVVEADLDIKLQKIIGIDGKKVLMADIKEECSDLTKNFFITHEMFGKSKSHLLLWNEIIKTNPKGQSQRYQTENYTNYFARWSSHIIDAKNSARNSSNIVLVNYSELENNFETTIEYICEKLKINIFQQPKKPNKEKFIYGKAMEICDKEKILMKNFIKEEIKKFPNLPNDLLNLF